MTKAYILIIVICLLAAGGLRYHAIGEDYGASNFSAQGRKLQPPPSGHTPGKDNGPGTGTHNTGEDCGICHTPGGKAANYVFTIAGTLYEDRAGTNVIKGGEVILQDINGNVISMTSNEAGNFWTYAPIGSNPKTVSAHGTILDKLYSYDTDGNLVPANPDDPRTWQYKSWVRNGDRFTRMVTIAPVGGAMSTGSSTARMSCNMHHASLGSRGGLWLPMKDTLPFYPQTSLSFKKHILPIFRNKCVPCHIPGNTVTRSVTESDLATPSTSMDYSKGLDLTSYAGSSVSGITKRGSGELALPFRSSPGSSPILAMPSSQSAHPGGLLWTVADSDYKAIRQWIIEGAQNN